MSNSFKKSNFALWVKIANYARVNKKIHSIKCNRDWASREIKKLHDMKLDGYLRAENSIWGKESFIFTPTEKFKKEFKEKYKEISKRVRPDFTDETINKILGTFDF